MRRGVPTLIFVMIVVAGLGYWAWVLRRSVPAPTVAEAAAPANDDLRVMTANIRLSEPGDGENAWPNRRELLVQTLRKYDPDIIGCQEVSPAQGAYLTQELAPWYSYYPRAGVSGGAATGESATETGRVRVSAAGGDGSDGEGAAGLVAAVAESFASLNTIFYRANRFDAVEGRAGLVIPDELQARPTENTFYSLLVLRPKASGGGGGTLIVVDVHLRHDAAFATRCATRVHSLIAATLLSYPGSPVILMGDMNHDRTSQPYAALVGGAAPALRDTFDYARKPANESWGNWHGFTGVAQAPWPTDLIFIGGALQAVAPGATLIRDHGPSGRYPSDHFFVMADLVKP